MSNPPPATASAAEPAPSPPNPWRRRAVAVALAASVALLYSPARHFAFLYLDDNEYVTENPAVRAGLNADSVHWALTAYHSGH